MTLSERFCFTLEATGAAEVFADAKTGQTSGPARAPSQSSAGVVELLSKWGLGSGDPARDRCGTVLQRYSYRVERDRGMQGEGTPGDDSAVPASALRFHEGLADDFLSALFSSEEVQATLRLASGGAKSMNTKAADPAAFGVAVKADRLRCTWVDMNVLDARLRGKGIVRFPSESRAVAEQEDDAQEPVLPTVSRMEEQLPNGAVITDELRALFLQAHSRPNYGEDDVDNIMGNDGANCDGDDSDGYDDDDGYFGYGEKLDKRTLRAIFTANDRKEFLYHILWRLIAGGGVSNQFDDDFGVYKRAARDVYRSAVTSLLVQRVEGKTAAVEDELAEGQEGAEASFVPQIHSMVFQVNGFGGKKGSGNIARNNGRLFPGSNGLSPSNENYCYVIVNPLQQTAVLWYHGCG